MHELRKYDDGMERCIGCELCAVACPANAITVIGAENDPAKPVSPGERYGYRYEIDMLRCIFCGWCEEACPTDAIVLTPRFDIADFTRDRLVFGKDKLLVKDPFTQHMANTESASPSDTIRPRPSIRAVAAEPRCSSFWICAVVLVVTGIGVVASRQPVHSVVGLIVNFTRSAVLFLTLSAEFLAMMQIIIYAGAILVLFLFVIALLTIGESAGIEIAARPARAFRPRRRSWPAIAALALMAAGVRGARGRTRPRADRRLRTVATFGQQLLTTHLFAFEVTAFILLIAIVGVVLMAGRKELRF